MLANASIRMKKLFSNTKRLANSRDSLSERDDLGRQIMRLESETCIVIGDPFLPPVARGHACPVWQNCVYSAAGGRSGKLSLVVIVGVVVLELGAINVFLGMDAVERSAGRMRH